MRLMLRLAAAVVLVALFVLMVGPFQDVQAATGVWDKAAHAVAFFIITICLAIDFPFGRFITLIAVAMALGGVIEVIQGWTGRDASGGDLAADAIGVAAAVVVLAVLRRWKSRQLQTSNTR